ncbi:MAG: hypothetical protein M1834_009072, partial [Cirrosporium novae-zelandiae]
SKKAEVAAVVVVSFSPSAICAHSLYSASRAKCLEEKGVLLNLALRFRLLNIGDYRFGLSGQIGNLIGPVKG